MDVFSDYLIVYQSDTGITIFNINTQQSIQIDIHRCGLCLISDTHMVTTTLKGYKDIEDIVIWDLINKTSQILCISLNLSF